MPGREVPLKLTSPVSTDDFTPSIPTAQLKVPQDEVPKKATGESAWAERISALGTLAAGVAHEVNNPLAFVRSNIEYAIRELPRLHENSSPERLHELVTALRESLEGVDRVAQVVSSVRMFAQEDRGAIGPIQVRKLVDAAVQIARPQVSRKAKLELDLRGVPEVLANEPRLAQVVLKLLVHAGRSTAEGREDQTVTVGTEYDTDLSEVAISVCWTGQVLSLDEIDRAFDFSNGDEHGEGVLGLPLCYRLITSMGGGMTISSTTLSGTIVRVVLPAVPPQVRPA